MPVEVQVLSSAPCSERAYGGQCRKPFFRWPGGFPPFFRQQSTFAAFPKGDATMAGMRRKGDGWHGTFRFRGMRYYFAAGSLTEEQARGVEVDETLDVIERGWLTVPKGEPRGLSPLAARPGSRRPTGDGHRLPEAEVGRDPQAVRRASRPSFLVLPGRAVARSRTQRSSGIATGTSSLLTPSPGPATHHDTTRRGRYGAAALVRESELVRAAQPGDRTEAARPPRSRGECGTSTANMRAGIDPNSARRGRRMAAARSSPPAARGAHSEGAG
jgi:hypothetical protein